MGRVIGSHTCMCGGWRSSTRSGAEGLRLRLQTENSFENQDTFAPCGVPRSVPRCHHPACLLPLPQGVGYSEEELPASLVDELEERVSPEQRHFAAFQARVRAFVL